MKLLDDVFEKLGRGMDHVGSALERLISSEVSYDSTKTTTEPIKYKPEQLVAAIAYNETRGVKTDPYKFRKPSGVKEYGDDMGKYQVTEAELKSWSPEFMGRAITPEQYMEDPKLQDEYNTKKVSKLQEIGATPEEIFAMHRGGLTHFMDPEVRKRRVGERREYVDSAIQYLNTL